MEIEKLEDRIDINSAEAHGKETEAYDHIMANLRRTSSDWRKASTYWDEIIPSVTRPSKKVAIFGLESNELSDNLLMGSAHSGRFHLQSDFVADSLDDYSLVTSSLEKWQTNGLISI